MTVYHVATTGNNGNNGTSLALAKLTIQAGIGLLGPGDLLYLHAGTYREIIAYNSFTIPSGTSGNPITISGFPGDTAILAPPPGTSVMTNPGISGIQTYGQSYLTFKDFILDGEYNPSTLEGFRGGMTLDALNGPASYNIIVDNVEVKRIALNAIFIAADGTIIRRCRLHDSGKNGDFSPAFAYGIYMVGANILIEDNEIYDNGRYGIQCYSQVGYLHDDIIRNNYIHDNTVSALGTGIITGGQRMLFYNNVIEGHSGAGIEVNYSNPVDVHVYHNTIYNNAGYAVIDGTGNGSVRTVVKNNIFSANGNDSVQVGAFASGSQSSNNLTADPLFVTPGSDYHLRVTSPALAYGVDVGITLDKDGVARPVSTPAAGAYEGTGTPVVVSGDPPIESFAYTPSTPLNGKNGGSLWSTSWIDYGAQAASIEAELPGGDGGMAAKFTPTTSSLAIRGFEAVDTGTFLVILRATFSTAAEMVGVFLCDGGVAGEVGRAGVRIGPTGDIEAYDGATDSYVSVAAYSADTWVEVSFELDRSGHPDHYRVAVNGGTPSAWLQAFVSMAYVDALKVLDYHAGTLWIGAIGIAMPVIPATGPAQLQILRKIFADVDFDWGVKTLSLHSGPPGLTGANEISGGSYVRKTEPSWSSASGGIVLNAGTVHWIGGLGITSTTITHIGLWAADGMFIAAAPLSAPKTVTLGKEPLFPIGTIAFNAVPFCSVYLANLLLDYIFNAVDFDVAPGYWSLHTGAVSTTGANELTGGSYVRQVANISDWDSVGASISGDTLYRLLYGAAVTWPGLPAATVTRVGYWDASSAGNFLMFAPDVGGQTTRIVAAGEGVTVDADVLGGKLVEVP